jgi:signal transduction histidine kinase
MDVTTTTVTPAASPGPAATAANGVPEPVLGRALLPGVVLLGGSREPRSADQHALALFGCRDGAELAARWAAIQPRLEALRDGPAPELELPAAVTGGRRLRVVLVRVDRCDAADGGEALLVQDAEVQAALESDLRAASQLRSLAQVTPAVAHDLRAPINAMVLNLEVLKETLAAGPSLPSPAIGPGGRDPRERQRHYVAVLREELARLHQSLELFLAHISPRGDRLESLDLREPARDLAALLRPPARKQQAQIEVLLPDAPVPVLGQRHQLRQSLLHLGLAALAQVPRDGTLEIRLERLPGSAPSPGAGPRAAPEPSGRATPEAPPTSPQSPPAPAGIARLRISAAAGLGARGGDGTAAGPALPAPPFAAPPEPRFSGAGTEARLEVARSIVAALGGSLRQEGAEPDGSRGAPAFELRFPLCEPS